MAPIVVKFEDKYSSPAATKPSTVEKKLRRSGKPLTLAELKKKNEQANAVEGPTSAKDLKDDLELQRLLSESSILKSLANERRNNNTESGAELTLKTLNEPLIGKARVRTLDSRIKQVASVNGDPKILNKVEKMPMKLRQAMIKKHQERTSKVEREALENGIVLSKSKKGSFRDIGNDRSFIAKEKLLGKGNMTKNRLRDRGLKIQTVGRSTRNGLVLSKSDIARIEGPKFVKKGKHNKHGRK
ncbi:hypothetical protein CANINC_005043 [Pichia inconspicua]|uniref:Uncharacterized protein n=1 Tax=Pichia inconspicua TaxID=52247 RepID=A0A4V4NF19_9ASCO|nr:hypothetical protein CANINC_005043 [[Candida] inconspicua]